MEPFDENGEYVQGEGHLTIDPTHHKYAMDPRYNGVRSIWAISHGADVSAATAEAVTKIVPAAPPSS